MIELVMLKRGCSYDELFEAYCDVCKENKALQKDFDDLDEKNLEIITANEELKKQISEIESELAVKEDLLKIKNRLCGKEPLPFTDEQYEEELIEELEERHQQDCITINQLHTTIDTLVDRYAKVKGNERDVDVRSNIGSYLDNYKNSTLRTFTL